MPSSQLIWQTPQWPQLVAPGEGVTAAVALARQRQGELAGQMLAIGVSATDPLVQVLWINEVIATAAIEGEDLNPASVRSSVMRKLGLHEDKASPSSRQIDGLVDVLNDATVRPNEPLTHERLCQWQAVLFPTGMSGLQAITTGRYRDHADAMQIVSGPLGRETVHYTAPPSLQVEREMKAFLDWFEATRPQPGSPALDGLVRAAIAHLWFESIHPFEDGNGRLGRAVVDLAMTQSAGLMHTSDAPAQPRLVSLSRQILQHRRAYYDALHLAQHGGCDVSAWVIWFAGMWTLACEDASAQVGTARAKSQFWSQHAQQNLNPRQRKVLQRLLNDGDGGFLGGLNADKYIKMTGTSKATATRDLAALVQAGMLCTQGQGKAQRYYANVAGWKHGLART